MAKEKCDKIILIEAWIAANSGLLARFTTKSRMILAIFTRHLSYAEVSDYTTVSNESVTGGIFGIAYHYGLLLSNKFDLAIVPKFGFGSVTVDLGAIENYGRLPIITDSGTFYEGDAIEAEASGSMLSIALKANYKINDLLGVFAQIGFQSSAFSEPVTTVAGTEITDTRAFDSGTLRGNTISYAPSSNIDPFEDAKVDMSGLVMVFGVSYVF